MAFKFVSILATILAFSALFVDEHEAAAPVESLSTRSTRAEGVLLCGKEPAAKAYVRLFKINSDGEH